MICTLEMKPRVRIACELYLFSLNDRQKLVVVFKLIILVLLNQFCIENKALSLATKKEEKYGHKLR